MMIVIDVINFNQGYHLIMKKWKKNNKRIPDPYLGSVKLDAAIEREISKSKPLNWFTPEFMAKVFIKHRSKEY